MCSRLFCLDHPLPPCGQWTRTIGSHFRETLRSLDAFTRSPHRFSSLAYGTEQYPLVRTPLGQPPSRDPNVFYYKPSLPKEPQASFSLECDQWRHQDGKEPFLGEIHVPADQDNAEGEVVCRIQAANLSKPISKRIPVWIEITHVNAFESAQKMVEALLEIRLSLHDFFGE